jgi:hypothetical protein
LRLTELLLLAVLGWSVWGIAGVALRFRRGEGDVARRHGLWLVGVWVLYAVALAGASLLQAQRVVPIGADQCFGEMCFAVLAVHDVPGLIAGETGRVIQVTLSVRNHGHTTERDSLVDAYLLDRQGRRWHPLPGLAGNALRARMLPGAEIESEPVFQVSRDATGLALVLTHGRWQLGRLVIGDPDSLGHRPTVTPLDNDGLR